MKTVKILLILFIVSVSALEAQQINLKFGEDRKFKIIQFTDVHYKQGKPESKVAIDLINEVLDAEKPDFVVFTGDIIWAKPVKEGLDEVFAPVIERKIPWAYVFGNHDDEFDVSRLQLMDYVMQKPYCMATHGDKSLSGVGNYILEVKGSTNEKTEALLYCMDSHAYTPIKGIGSYAWFDTNQVNWYINQSASYTKSNADLPYPALAFFHIPLPEYVDMAAQKEKLIGTKTEKECNGKLNTGMFAAMRQAADVMATFVGHDHDNDYIGNWYNIYMAYGRYSGGKTVYNNLGLNGCRVIIMEQGKREFSTYIRLLGGEKLHQVKYPETFAKKDEKTS